MDIVRTLEQMRDAALAKRRDVVADFVRDLKFYDAAGATSRAAPALRQAHEDLVLIEEVLADEVAMRAKEFFHQEPTP